MSNKKIVAMLRELVNEVDYDRFKDLFLYGGEQGAAGPNMEVVGRLIQIVKKYVKDKPSDRKKRSTREDRS
jgi:hypothetical protein